MRTYPRPNRVYPLPNRVYPVAASGEAFGFAAGSSRRVLLNETVQPFGDLYLSIGNASVQTVEYMTSGASAWTAVTAGSHADAVESLRNLQTSLTKWRDPDTWHARITDNSSNVVSGSVTLTCNVSLAQTLIVAAQSATVKPFVSSEFAYTPSGITAVQYSVSGAASAALGAIPRQKVVTGAHDGSNNASALSDSSADFIAHGVKVGDAVANDTDGSEASVTVVSATILQGALSGGTENDWDSGETFTVYAEDDLVRRAQSFQYTPTASGTHKVTLSVNDGSAVSTAFVNVVVT